MLQYIYFVVYDLDVGTMTFEYPGQCHIFISLSFLYISTLIDWFSRRKSRFFPDNFLLTHNEDRQMTIVWMALMYPVHLHTFNSLQSDLTLLWLTFTELFFTQTTFYFNMIGMYSAEKDLKNVVVSMTLPRGKISQVELCFKWLQPYLTRLMFDQLTGHFQ